MKDIESLLAAEHLTVLGGFTSSGDEPDLPAGTRSVLMIGCAEPGFWAHFTQSAEWRDGRSDPMDRWSRRVIGGLACKLGVKALFPFGGPPWRPFYRWALRTGRVWESPVRLLVHADQGLLVSFRGALALRQAVEIPGPAMRPCDNCDDQPCLSTCPVAALSPDGYAVDACHGHLDTSQGAPCLAAGCLARRACPVSAAYARLPEQSAYHMRQFHK